jgi:hypothetical protein
MYRTEDLLSVNAFYTPTPLCISIILLEQCRYNMEDAMPSLVNNLMMSRSVPSMVLCTLRSAASRMTANLSGSHFICG